MNTRIKELLAQTETDISGKWISVESAGRFAQLIVKECIVKISQEQDLAEQNWLCDNGVHICHELTKHFGVEE